MAIVDTHKTASRRVDYAAGWQSISAHLERKGVGDSQLLHHRVEERLHRGVRLIERQEAMHYKHNTWTGAYFTEDNPNSSVHFIWILWDTLISIWTWNGWEMIQRVFLSLTSKKRHKPILKPFYTNIPKYSSALGLFSGYLVASSVCHLISMKTSEVC